MLENAGFLSEQALNKGIIAALETPADSQRKNVRLEPEILKNIVVYQKRRKQRAQMNE
jgi:hypothetical protein